MGADGSEAASPRTVRRGGQRGQDADELGIQQTRCRWEGEVGQGHHGAWERQKDRSCGWATAELARQGARRPRWSQGAGGSPAAGTAHAELGLMAPAREVALPLFASPCPEMPSPPALLPQAHTLPPLPISCQSHCYTITCCEPFAGTRLLSSLTVSPRPPPAYPGDTQLCGSHW